MFSFPQVLKATPKFTCFQISGQITCSDGSVLWEISPMRHAAAVTEVGWYLCSCLLSVESHSSPLPRCFN